MQTGKSLFALHIILPQEGEGRSEPFSLLLSVALYMATVIGKLTAPLAEGMARTEHRPTIAGMPINHEHLERCHIVEQPTPHHHPTEVFVGQTLVEHGQIVAEVQIGLPGIVLG